MTTPGVAITASGMVTAVGFNSPATCAAIRANISGVAEDNIWDPTGGRYIGVARPRTPQWWEGPDMLAELAAPAISECLAALPRDVEASRIPILLVLSPAGRPEREPDLESVILSELPPRLGFELAPGSGAFLGRTKLLSAMRKAAEMFQRGEVHHVLVAGVDTFLRQRVVDAYIARRRVLTATNSNGFIPGEAACAVLLEPWGRRRTGEIRILGVGKGYEAGAIDADQPLSGNGLTESLRQALAASGVTMAETDYWLTDQNAEGYKAKECTVAQIRLERRDRPAPRPYPIWRPITCLGEIGSATGPALLGIALEAGRGGYAPGPLILMHLSEDDGTRAGFVLQWAEGS